MIFDTAIEIDRQKLRQKIDWVVNGKRKIEVLDIRAKRSSNQNDYLHVILGMYAINFGLSLEEAKMDYKRINSDIYKYEKGGKVYFRSSSSLNTKEMSESIERFRNYSAKEGGFYLPSAMEGDYLEHGRVEIKKHKQYL